MQVSVGQRLASKINDAWLSFEHPNRLLRKEVGLGATEILFFLYDKARFDIYTSPTKEISVRRGGSACLRIGWGL